MGSGSTTGGQASKRSDSTSSLMNSTRLSPISVRKIIAVPQLDLAPLVGRYSILKERRRNVKKYKLGRFHAYQFALYVKLSVKHALGNARKQIKNRDVSVAAAGRSRSIVRLISDALSQSQTANGKTHGPVAHDVLIDQSQITLAARVTAFLLEAHTYDETERIAKTLELIANMHRSGGKATHIATGDRLTKWATKVRENKPPKTKLVVAVRDLLEEFNGASFSGSPAADWVHVRSKIEASDAGDLSKVADFVRFLRILRRGSAIEESLSELWRRQGDYRGAMQAVDDAILREQSIDNVRPPATCTVMTMHQLKSREYDAVVIIEDQHRRFLGRGENPARIWRPAGSCRFL